MRALTWEQVNSQSEQIECPNIIIFGKKTYRILNDCYGDDPKSPIMETGEFKQSDNALVLTHRKIKTSDLFSNQDDLHFQLIRFGDFVKLKYGERTYFFTKSAK